MRARCVKCVSSITYAYSDTDETNSLANGRDTDALGKVIQEKEALLEQLQGQLAVLRAEKFCQSDRQTAADPRALAGADAAVLASCAALTAAFVEAFGIEFQPCGNQALALASFTAGRNVVSVDSPGAGKTLTLFGESS